MLGIHYRADSSLVVASGGYCVDAMHGLFIVVASLVEEQRLSWASVVASPGL